MTAAELLASSALSTALLAGIGFVLRDAVSNLVAKSVQHDFDEQLEATKAEFRRQELVLSAKVDAGGAELQHLRASLSDARHLRSTVLFDKRIEASVAALNYLKTLQGIGALCEMLKVMKRDAVAKEYADPEMQQVFQLFLESYGINKRIAELSQINRRQLELFLSKKTLDWLGAYEATVFEGMLFAQTMALGVDPRRYLNRDVALDRIKELIPTAKESLDKQGIWYAFYWLEFFGDHVVSSMRANLEGIERESEEVGAAVRTAVDAKLARVEVITKLRELNVPNEFLKEEFVEK